MSLLLSIDNGPDAAYRDLNPVAVVGMAMAHAGGDVRIPQEMCSSLGARFVHLSCATETRIPLDCNDESTLSQVHAETRQWLTAQETKIESLVQQIRASMYTMKVSIHGGKKLFEISHLKKQPVREGDVEIALLRLLDTVAHQEMVECWEFVEEDDKLYVSVQPRAGSYEMRFTFLGHPISNSPVTFEVREDSSFASHESTSDRSETIEHLLPDDWKKIFRASKIDLSRYTSPAKWKGLMEDINLALCETYGPDAAMPSLDASVASPEPPPVPPPILQPSSDVAKSPTLAQRHLQGIQMFDASSLKKVNLPEYSRPSLAHSIFDAVAARIQERRQKLIPTSIEIEKEKARDYVSSYLEDRNLTIMDARQCGNLIDALGDSPLYDGDGASLRNRIVHYVKLNPTKDHCRGVLHAAKSGDLGQWFDEKAVVAPEWELALKCMASCVGINFTIVDVINHECTHVRSDSTGGEEIMIHKEGDHWLCGGTITDDWNSSHFSVENPLFSV